MKAKRFKVKTSTPKISREEVIRQIRGEQMFKRLRQPPAESPIVPSDITLTIKQPEIVEAVKALVAAAMAYAEKESTKEYAPYDDPNESRRLDLEAVRNDIDRDRQRLAWAEFELRKAEWEERLRETRERADK